MRDDLVPIEDAPRKDFDAGGISGKDSGPDSSLGDLFPREAPRRQPDDITPATTVIPHATLHPQEPSKETEMLDLEDLNARVVSQDTILLALCFALRTAHPPLASVTAGALRHLSAIPNAEVIDLRGYCAFFLDALTGKTPEPPPEPARPALRIVR